MLTYFFFNFFAFYAHVYILHIFSFIFGANTSNLTWLYSPLTVFDPPQGRGFLLNLKQHRKRNKPLYRKNFVARKFSRQHRRSDAKPKTTCPWGVPVDCTLSSFIHPTIYIVKGYTRSCFFIQILYLP